MPQDFIRQRISDILAYRSLRPVDKLAKLRQLQEQERGRTVTDEVARRDNLAMIDEALQGFEREPA